MTNRLPDFKKDQAATALASASGIVVRLRAMRDAKTRESFDALRVALKFDIDALLLSTQNL